MGSSRHNLPFFCLSYPTCSTHQIALLVCGLALMVDDINPALPALP